MPLRNMLVILFALLCYGCGTVPNFHEWAKSGIGQHVDLLRSVNARPGSYASRVGWKETTYPLDNGNWVFVDPLQPGCSIHWELNPQGIVVGYKFVGFCPD